MEEDTFCNEFKFELFQIKMEDVFCTKTKAVPLSGGLFAELLVRWKR